jgi:hypothetical protein
MGAYRNDTGKTLYVNADKTKVVPEGEEAAFVLCGPGGEVPDAEAKLYHLGDYAPKSKAEHKAVQPKENK